MTAERKEWTTALEQAFQAIWALRQGKPFLAANLEQAFQAMARRRKEVEPRQGKGA